MFIKIFSISMLFLMSSSVQATKEDNLPRFKTQVGVYGLKSDFSSIQKSLGVLENLKQLNQQNKAELETTKKRLDIIKKKYKTDFTDGMWASSQDAYDRGQQVAFQLDKKNEMSVERGKRDAQKNGEAYDATFDDAYTCSSQKGVRSNNDTEYKFGTYTFQIGDRWEYSSDYVDAINSARAELSIAIYRLEKLLPTTPVSGMLMMTQSDMDREQSPKIYCTLPGGKENPMLARDQASKKARQEKSDHDKRRVPPYSESKTKQHEMVCRTLEQGVPPPFDAKCVYNYK